MPRHYRPQLLDRCLSALAVLLTLVFCHPVWAADPAGRQLQLEVFVNGHASNFVTPFTDVPGKGLVTTRGELAELFIRVPGEGAATDVVALTSIPGLKYDLDEAKQKIEFVLGDALRVRRIYDVKKASPAPTAGTADYGLVTNYQVYSSATQNPRTTYAPTFSGSNVSLDQRVITPFGTLNQTSILGQNFAGNTGTLRLDTYATRVDPEGLKTYRVGDTVTGGLAWTHPIRIGGAQVQHDYTFRPDLVTSSLPNVSGSAAVPSTVDVYINNVKAISQPVGVGPYQITNLPMYSGGGDARVVLRDASGKETETALSFFASPRVLREGIYESSLEIGAPRLRYGLLSDDYEAQVVGSGTLRLGVSDWLTLESHGEGGLGVVNGGVGAVAKVGKLGVINTAVSGSTSHGRSGTQTYASLDTNIGAVSLHLSSQRAIAGYDDLATATAKLRPAIFQIGSGFASYGRPSGKTIRSLDGISFGVPLEFDHSNISTSFLQAKTDDGQSTRVATVTYSRPLFENATLSASAFRDFADNKGTGVYVGVTMRLGKTPLGTRLGENATATVGLQNSAQAHSITTDISSSADNSVGAWGWRVRESEGTQTQREAGINYRTPIARIDATVGQRGDGMLGRVQVDGAVVAMGNTVYFANRIDDGFGVVSTGAPGVKVTQEGMFVGTTDEDGKLLVPNLRSHSTNRIGIDATNLPVDAEVEQTSQRVTPAFRSGVYVDFAVKTSVPAAIVSFTKSDGTFVQAGSELTLAGDPTPYLVGYDGQVFIKKLGDQNKVTIKFAEGGTCNAAFNYKLKRGEQSVIGPVTCQ
jgi:outer membrane usher protein